MKSPKVRAVVRCLAALATVASLSRVPAAEACLGDCNDDGRVAINELVHGVNIALNNAGASACPTLDRNHNGQVSVDELVAAVARALNGCGSAQESQAFVVATDFETGSFATITLDTPRVIEPASASRRISSDATARAYSGLVYIINRFGGDSVQVLDPATQFSTTVQCSTGSRSNPHDIAFVDANKAYVTLSDRTDLLIIDPSPAADCSDFVRGSIDLAGFADADGFPEMDQMAIVGDRLYVSLQHLDRNNSFVPAGRGSIVVINLATDTVVGEITLTGENPFGATKGLTAVGEALLIPEAGRFGANDGGIERVDLASMEAEGFFITEAQLGGDVADLVMVSNSSAYAVVSHADFTNSLVAFDPITGTVTNRFLEGNGYLADAELNDRGELFVADRTATRPGIRILRASNGSELTEAPLDTGLPPFEIVFLR